MLTCDNCETGQFLQIVKSSMRLDDGDVKECHEEIECTMCGAGGTYDYRSGEYHQVEDIDGQISLDDEKPLGVLGELHQL